MKAISASTFRILLLAFSLATAPISAHQDSQNTATMEAPRPTRSSRCNGFKYLGPISDAHVHYVGFAQQTDGIERMRAAFLRTRVRDVMLFGMPLTMRGGRQYYLNEDGKPVGVAEWDPGTDIRLRDALLIALNQSEREHIHPFIAGVNPKDAFQSVTHIEKLLAEHPGFWAGIGEVFGRHDQLGSVIAGGEATAKDEGMARILELAGKHDLPVSLHNNITEVGHPAEKGPLYLDEFDELLGRYPNTRVIWCHAGISRNLKVNNLPGILREQLRKHPNLYVDLSWVVYENYVAKDLDTWAALLEEFPDRFMIGSDTVGTFDANYDRQISKYDELLDKLTPKTALKVAHDNFIRVLPKRIRDRRMTGR